jgi:hypothetical protein
MTSVRDARRAVGRGASDEALVLLWNELEPARLSGDRRRLAAIADLAQRIAAAGDEAERREAERLLEQVRAYAAAGEADRVATARLDAEVSAVGAPPSASPGPGPVGPVGPEGPEGVGEGEDGDGADGQRASGRGSRIGTLLWLAIFAGIVLLNALRGTGE